MSAGGDAWSWDAALEDGLELPAGLDLGALLGFGSSGDGDGDGDDGGTAGDLGALVADVAVGGGGGLLDAGFDAALELLDVGGDLDDG